MRVELAQRASAWLHGHDTGLSSKAIFHYMTLGVKNGYTPSDPADLGRCLRLLNAFPEWKPRMPEMAQVSKAWKILMQHWDEVVASYHAETGEEGMRGRGNWSAPQTFNLMQKYEYRDPEVWRMVLDGEPA